MYTNVCIFVWLIDICSCMFIVCMGKFVCILYIVYISLLCTLKAFLISKCIKSDTKTYQK